MTPLGPTVPPHCTSCSDYQIHILSLLVMSPQLNRLFLLTTLNFSDIDRLSVEWGCREALHNEVTGFYLGFLVWGRRSGLKLMVGGGVCGHRLEFFRGVWGHGPPEIFCNFEPCESGFEVF